MTDLTLDIAPVLSTPDFVVRPLVPVTLALPSIEGQIFDSYTKWVSWFDLVLWALDSQIQI